MAHSLDSNNIALAELHRRVRLALKAIETLGFVVHWDDLECSSNRLPSFKVVAIYPKMVRRDQNEKEA